MDASRNVVLADDPDGHNVEVSVRRHWILGRASNVTIRGFTMRDAANGGRSGAIMNRVDWSKAGYANWTLEDNRLSDAHGAVVSVAKARGIKLLNNDISRGGQLGILNTGRGEVIRGNKVYDNNTEDFDWRWEAGGMKTSHAKNVTVDSNKFHDNKGNAIWFDIDSSNNTISNNRIYSNARFGVHYEISESGRIFGNVLWENGWSTPKWALGSAIASSNSSDMSIHDNTLAWNADGIAVIGLDRGKPSWNRVHNVYVHGNIILVRDRVSQPKDNFALAWLQGWNDEMFNPANNNRGEDNRFWFPEPKSDSVRFVWDKVKYSKLSNFGATPGGEYGRYISRNEKDVILKKEDLPAHPEPR